MVARLEAEAPKICAALGVDLSTRVVGSFDPPAFDECCVAAVRSAAERLGYSHRDIVSGAGTSDPRIHWDPRTRGTDHLDSPNHPL